MPSVYLETTIISYLAAWPSSDVVVAGHQQTTHDWWNKERSGFDLYVSELVLREIAAGDPQAAQHRLAFVVGITPLTLTPVTLALAKELVAQGAIPAVAMQDALHLAIAAVNALDYLLTGAVSLVRGFRPRFVGAGGEGVREFGSACDCRS
jgi:hypothetical protein